MMGIWRGWKLIQEVKGFEGRLQTGGPKERSGVGMWKEGATDEAGSRWSFLPEPELLLR